MIWAIKPKLHSSNSPCNNAPPLQVHDDGSISGAVASRPVIDPNHSNVCLRAPFLCSPLEMAQDRIIAGRHPDALHHAFAWPTPNAMTEKMNEFLGSLGSMRLWRGNLRQLLNKRSPLACFVAASPAPHAKLHRDACPLRRQILEMTLVPAVTRS